MGAEKSMNVNNNYAVRQGTSAAVTERTARYLAFKRFMDIVFALAGLLAALPVMGLFSILIRLESPGPAFYKQERVGKDGKPFYLYSSAL